MHRRYYAWSLSIILLIIFAFMSNPLLAAVKHPLQTKAAGVMPPPRFFDPDRARKLAAAFPEIEKLFTAWVERLRMPGAVMGIIIDGELAWVKTAGVSDLKSRAPVTPDTVFRIASMTKSFTAMAILKLRDEGKLSLDDPVSRYVPALSGLAYPTKDSPVITVRHLLTHSEGFPEDNPWGDRQLAQSDQTIQAWMRSGIPFSNAPGVAFEYSNYGFAILGQIIAKASGRSYAEYLRDNILKPLGMNSSTLEATEIPRDRIAYGYRRENNELKDEALLAHGSFGAMGGLWTSARDLARYVSFLMSAFPPRDEAERGPVRRSSAREMQQAARSQSASALRNAVDGPLLLNSSAYGYGLGVSQDCRFSHIVGHGGGLPGYGSLMRWLPEHGVGLIAMANVTYAGFGGLLNDAISALHRTGALQPRVAEPSEALLAAQKDVSQLIMKWDDKLAARIAADNLAMDESMEKRAAEIRELNAKHGACNTVGPVKAENALRGNWRISCERGWLDVYITLAPTMPPRVQYLGFQSVIPPGDQAAKKIETVIHLINRWDDKSAQSLAGPGVDIERMRRQLQAASLWGGCKMGEALAGDGERESLVKLVCEKGTLLTRVEIDPASQKLTYFNMVPARDQRCVP